MNRLQSFAFQLLLLAGLASCGASGEVVVDATQSSEVSFRVTVVDHHNFVIENVEVRVISAWNEWSDLRALTESSLSSQYTDSYGEAVFGPSMLAAINVGFLEIPRGRAVLTDHPSEDEASIKVLVGANSLGWVEFEIPVDFENPFGDYVVEF